MSERPGEEPLYTDDQDLELEDAELEQPEAPPQDEPSPQGAVGPPQFSYNQRLYAFGYTGTGKSEILNLLFSGVQCQKLLIDNKPEFQVDGVEPVSDVEEIDWREPVIHYQVPPGADTQEWVEDLFATAFTRRGLTICVHEWGALVDYNANKAGRYLISYVAQGERLGLGLLAGSTRPKLIPVAGITEASHFLVFGPNFAKRDDMDAAAEAISPVQGTPINAYELSQELGQLEEHGFLWKVRREQQLIAMPPLPEHLRRMSIVRRSEDA